MLITGHRGAAGLAPENTLGAIQKALDYQIDRIEIDIQQTKDKVLVAMHDKSLNRTSTGKGYIKDHTFQEIAHLSAGAYFSQAYQTEKIPRLEEILELINGKAKLVIDIKYGNNYYSGIEERLLSILSNQGVLDNCIIHSFSDEILQTFHKLNPNLYLGKLMIGKIPFLPFIIDNQLRYSAQKSWGSLHIA